jgi:hypothetical protein
MNNVFKYFTSQYIKILTFNNDNDDYNKNAMINNSITTKLQ